MKSFGKLRVKYSLTFITGIIAGVLIGITVLTSLISYRIDNYYQEVRKLQTIIEEKDIKLKKLDQKLEESVNKNRILLKDVQVVLLFVEDEQGDEIDKITIEKFIKEKYQHFLGEEVKAININIAAEIVDKRIFRMGGREYRLKVSRATLSEVLTLWIDVQKA